MTSVNYASLLQTHMQGCNGQYKHEWPKRSSVSFTILDMQLIVMVFLWTQDSIVSHPVLACIPSYLFQFRSNHCLIYNRQRLKRLPWSFTTGTGNPLSDLCLLFEWVSVVTQTCQGSVTLNMHWGRYWSSYLLQSHFFNHSLQVWLNPFIHYFLFTYRNIYIFGRFFAILQVHAPLAPLTAIKNPFSLVHDKVLWATRLLLGSCGVLQVSSRSFQ